MSQGWRFSVLLVDDDDIAAEAVARGLQKHGFDSPIVLAEDGVVALQILRGTHDRRIQKPYLALIDLHLPRMSGIEFLQELRADEDLRATVVFVLTGSASDDERARAYQQRIAGYLVKSGLGPQCRALARLLTEYQSTVIPP